MTSKPKCWPPGPEPGCGLWTDRLGREWEPYQRPGLLRNISSGEVRDADEVWDAWGPLIMPAGLAAALRRPVRPRGSDRPMTPPVHTARRGVCIVHFDPPCGRPAALYPSGWRCVPPDTRVDHPLAPKPRPEPEPEEAHRA